LNAVIHKNDFDFQTAGQGHSKSNQVVLGLGPTIPEIFIQI